MNELPKTHVFQGITKRMAHLHQTFLNQTNLLPHNRRQRGQHCRQGRKKSSFLLPFSNIGAYQRVLFWHFSVIEGCSRIVKLSAITFKKNVIKTLNKNIERYVAYISLKVQLGAILYGMLKHASNKDERKQLSKQIKTALGRHTRKKYNLKLKQN